MEILINVGPLVLELPAIMMLASIMLKAFKQCGLERKMPEFYTLKPILAETSLDQAFLLRLAIEVDELRQMQAHHNGDTINRYCQPICQTSMEVVDTVLAMNGYNPHPGEIYDEDDLAEISQGAMHS